MKTRICYFAIVILTGINNVISSEETGIPTFCETTARAIISPYTDIAGAKPLTVAQAVDIPSGYCLYRKKIDDNTYVLLQGKGLKSEENNLTPVALPDSITLETIIRNKLYELPRAEKNFEINEIFILRSGTIYTINVPSAYFYYHDSWCVLKSDVDAKAAEDQVKANSKSFRKSVVWLCILTPIVVVAVFIPIIAAYNSK